MHGNAEFEVPENAGPENNGPSRAGLDFDGKCHNADGTGKVQCTLFVVGST